MTLTPYIQRVLEMDFGNRIAICGSVSSGKTTLADAMIIANSDIQESDVLRTDSISNLETQAQIESAADWMLLRDHESRSLIEGALVIEAMKSLLLTKGRCYVDSLIWLPAPIGNLNTQQKEESHIVADLLEEIRPLLRTARMEIVTVTPDTYVPID